jgi:hypothetical protein
MSWNQAQQDTWNENNSEYTDEDDYSDDDEYAPLEQTSWGAQTINQNGTTEVKLSMDGWQSLIDPSIKLKAGGVGSGQLHRKGANFKPLDEQHIINQRLGKPIPKAVSVSKKKRGSKPKPKGPPPIRRPVHSSLVPPSSSAYRGREPLPNSGPWGTAQLSSTPFWEQPASSVNTGTFASKYASAPTAQAAPPTHQQSQTQQPQQTLKAPVAPPRQTEQPVPSFRPSATSSAASKYATSSGVSKYAPQPHSAPQPATTTNTASQPEQQQQLQQAQPEAPPLIYHKLDTPCLNFNIEITPGVNASLLVYEDDDPVDVVNQFEKDHHLVMNDMAKRRFAERVKILLSQYKSQ